MSATAAHMDAALSCSYVVFLKKNLEATKHCVFEMFASLAMLLLLLLMIHILNCTIHCLQFKKKSG